MASPPFPSSALPRFPRLARHLCFRDSEVTVSGKTPGVSLDEVLFGIFREKFFFSSKKYEGADSYIDSILQRGEFTVIYGKLHVYDALCPNSGK